MQIVIDVDKEDYEKIKKIYFVEDIKTMFNQSSEDRAATMMLYRFIDAIKDGIPLPKGHGRLIDADELYKQDKEEWLCPNNAPFISTDYAHVFAEIDHTPTIIEADKAGEEE